MELFTLSPVGIWTTSLVVLAGIFLIAALVGGITLDTTSEAVLAVVSIVGAAVFIIGLPVMLFTIGFANTLLYSIVLAIVALVVINIASFWNILFDY